VTTPPPGLLRGLADARLAPAIPQMHSQLERSWTVALLARTAALSRSAFFERFTRTVGLPPMEYLLAWRMAIAKDLLRREDVALADVAERAWAPASCRVGHLGDIVSTFRKMSTKPDQAHRGLYRYRPGIYLLTLFAASNITSNTSFGLESIAT
jgi:hypothetical protein